MSAPLVDAAASATGTVKGAFRAALERLSPSGASTRCSAPSCWAASGMLWLIFAFTATERQDRQVTLRHPRHGDQHRGDAAGAAGRPGRPVGRHRRSGCTQCGASARNRVARRAAGVRGAHDAALLGPEQRLTSAAQAAPAPCPRRHRKRKSLCRLRPACRCHRHPQRPLLPPVGRCLPRGCRRDNPTCRWRLRCPCRRRRF